MNKIKIASNDFQFIQRELWAKLHKNTIAKTLLNDENREVCVLGKYIKQHGISVFPYDFTKKYRQEEIELHYASDSGLFYTIYDNKKMFLKSTYKSEFRAKRYIKNILLEQDVQSPHRYLTENFCPQAEDIILDIGGAEGFFALKYITRVKKIYIFECDEQWIEAMQHTYKDYMEKVEIIKKYVCDYSDETHISLDDFIREHNLTQESLFIKMDAEGNEERIIQGASLIHRMNSSIRLAVCTYHLEDAEKMVRDCFDNWKIEASDGYMLYYYDYAIRKPYVRRGVLRISNV